MKASRVLFLVLVTWLFPFFAQASDHADPQWLKPEQAEANITGLFFFPEGDDYVAILNVRRALTAAPPYRLESFEYSIHMDLHSQVTFDNAEELARYGGSIPKPDRIDSDVILTFRLNNDASLKSKDFKGLKDPEKIRVYTGVRDDPFIFPRFFNVNVITMAVSIPKSAFPANQKNWLLWGTSKDIATGNQIDHVGRSNRTQLGRFDILNTVPPSLHVATLREAKEKRDKVQQFLLDCLPPLGSLNQLSGFQLRHYDFFPDVMVYTNQLPAGFPNGRRPPDDVSLLTCNQGDCPLQENAFIDTTQWPRQTVNDKPFQEAFPYLADPWPARPQKPQGSCWPYIWDYLIKPGVFVLALLGGLVYYWRRHCKCKKAVQAA